MRPFLNLTVLVSSTLRGLWPDFPLKFWQSASCFVVVLSVFPVYGITHVHSLSVCVPYVKFLQYVRQARPGAADRALLYSTFTVTTDQSLGQPQTAVRCASGLYNWVAVRRDAALGRPATVRQLSAEWTAHLGLYSRVPPCNSVAMSEGHLPVAMVTIELGL